MDLQKDYLYYFWYIDNKDWLREFAYLENDETLRGLTPVGWTDSKELVDLSDFNLEHLMCAQDIIKCYFNSPSDHGKQFVEDYNSYDFKHLVERLLNKVTKGRINYISNGTIILAMRHCRFRFQRIPGTSNCYFNAQARCYRRMEKALNS